jgi:hypothetical protein
MIAAAIKDTADASDSYYKHCGQRVSAMVPSAIVRSYSTIYTLLQ